MKKVFYWLTSKQSVSNYVSLCSDMHFLFAFSWQLVNLRYSTKFSLRAWNWQTNYVVCNCVCRGNGKITRKKVKIIIISCDYDHYDVASEMSPKSEFWILRLTLQKMMGFYYCEEYLRSTSNKLLLQLCTYKSKCSVSCHLQIDEKSIM